MRNHRMTTLAACLISGALFAPVGAAQAATFDVAVEDFFFTPDELYVNAGDTVTWTWTGEAPHNVTPVEEGIFEPSETITEGTFSVTFDEVGEVAYYCSLHADPDGLEGMVGLVKVLAQGEELPVPKPAPRPAPTRDAPRSNDNIGAALSWSSMYPADGATTVLLARHDLFADAVASGGVQGLLDAPLLLTDGAPADRLNDRVVAELDRLGAQEVIILGGPNAVSNGVESDLVAAGHTVRRVYGQDRIDTAVQYASEFFADATQAMLVRGYGTQEGTQAFADSLAAGGAAARNVIPILLSHTEQLSAATRAHLASSSITEVFVIGGEGALSAAVAADLEGLGITVTRVSGPDRFETAWAIAQQFYDFREEAYLLIDGTTADSWAAGATAASVAESAAVALVNGPDIPQAFLEPISFGTRPICGPQTNAVACERARAAASSGQFGDPGAVVGVMAGANEVPGPAETPEKTGDATVAGTDDPTVLCYELSGYGFDEPITAAHIHDGVVGVGGPPVVTLRPPVSGDEGGSAFVRSCAFDLDEALVADVLAHPADYYVNLHTASFPGGAMRGQLFAPDVIGLAELTGDAEVPPAEVAGGGFTALLTPSDDHTILCYYAGFEVGGESVTGMHVHQAPEGENGDVVVPLTPPEIGEGTVCVDADAAVIDAMLADPGGFYVNVHTDAHPGGALRGQLFNPFGG